MNSGLIKIFVPGRLCLMGEHSDWASIYRKENPEIEKGKAIVVGLNIGIHASCYKSSSFIFNDIKDKIELPMNYDDLNKLAKSNNYFSYTTSVAAYMLKKYQVNGLTINIDKNDLPIKKGLSSSAAVCILTVRAFNLLYNLELTIEQEMHIAYEAETNIGSKCGKLDQLGAYGNNITQVTFDKGNTSIEPINIKGEFNFVLVDLMGEKNTVKILNDLNNCYPMIKNDVDKNVHQALGVDNKNYVIKACEYLENGDHYNLGKLMCDYQNNFDLKVSPASDELTAPLLHLILNDTTVKRLSFGAKGVGSQGDGYAQVLVPDVDTAEELITYLKKQYRMDAFCFTIKSPDQIKRAIIPVGGFGTRMYPMTTLFPKEFLPVYDDQGNLKPAILYLLEELDEAGIEEIGLIIDDENKKNYEKFFFGKMNKKYLESLTEDDLKIYEKIKRISQKLTFIPDNNFLGFAHAVYLAKDFAKDEPVLLLLGDQIYKSNTNISCVKQIINNYNITDKLTISAFAVPLNETYKYGIMAGEIINDNNYFSITDFKEKPDINYAEKNLPVNYKNKTTYFSVFGTYVLNKELFAELDNNFNNKPNYDISLTHFLNNVRKKYGAVAFIPDGVSFDVGNKNSYKKTIEEFKENKND